MRIRRRRAGAVGRAVAGAAMHRVAQVARVAKPSRGRRDAIAEKEARTLVALVARGERSEANDTRPRSAPFATPSPS